MRTKNPNVRRATDTAEGRLAVRRTGSNGVRLIDAAGTEVFPATTIRVPWVVDLSDEEAQLGSSTGASYTNADTDQLDVGDVVVISSTSVATTTTARDTRPLGVVIGGGPVGAPVVVQTTGYVALVNVTAAVTANYYAETSTTAGAATQNSTRRIGSFGVFLTAGTLPSMLLFGVPDVRGDPALLGFTGEILISDTPAGSPLVFADLIQNEAQTDLVYADAG